MLSASVLSCNSDEVVTNENSSNENSVKLARSSSYLPELRTFELSNGENVQILSFANWNEFGNLADDLSNEVEIYDDNFLSDNAHLSDEALSIFEEETEYTDQVPLINFENSISFNQALRKRFNLENEAMLNTENLDYNLDPNINLAFSNGELSLVNLNQEVMVADTIYVFKNRDIGKIYGNFNSNLLNVRNNELTSESVTSAPGIQVTAKTIDPAECFTWRASSTDDNYSSRGRARLHAKIRSVPAYAKYEKMTVNYYKKNNGKWKEDRTTMALNLRAIMFNKCYNVDAINHPRNTFKKKKRRDNKETVWSPLYTYQTKLNGIYGLHYYAGKEVNYAIQ